MVAPYMIALACSTPPKKYGRWTLRLLEAFAARWIAAASPSNWHHETLRRSRQQRLEESATPPFCLVTLVGNPCANAVSQRKPND
jgi:hypothetical protein